MTIRSAESLPVLDFRALSDEQLATAQDIFEEFREKELKPAYIADADPNRALLDKRVVCDLLGFGPETYEAVRRLSAKWCAEPSVHGGSGGRGGRGWWCERCQLDMSGLTGEKVIKGIVNESLLPIVPVSVKKLDGDWQELDVLLDTGSEVGFMLAEATASQHGIAIMPDRNSPASAVPVSYFDSSIPMPLPWVELQLEGIPRVVECEIIKTDKYSGMIGPRLLLNRQVTVDVVRNGPVEIDCTPAPTALDRIRSRIRRRERQHPFPKYRWKLPWVNVAIKDSEGKWRSFSANVDTGNSEQLNLPPSYVERFGLRLPGKCQMNDTDGPFDTICGEVEMCWQGNLCTVQCVQHQPGKPPLIGMRLLRGNRITMMLMLILIIHHRLLRLLPCPGLHRPTANFL